jgi:hypothetical protein
MVRLETIHLGELGIRSRMPCWLTRRSSSVTAAGADRLRRQVVRVFAAVDQIGDVEGASVVRSSP